MNGPAPPPLLEGLARFVKGRARYLWLVGLGLYLLAIWFLGWRDLGEALWRIDLRFIAALMALDAAALWVRVLKWRIALGPGQRATALCFLSKAGGNLTPGRVGELSPLLLPRHRTAKIGAWIVMDRLMEAGTTLTLGLVGLFAVGLSLRSALFPWIAGVLACVAAVAYALTRRRLLKAAARAVRDGSLLQRGLSILASMSGEMARLGSKAPLLSAITFLTKCMDLAVSFLLLLSFGAWVPFAMLALAQCVHVLTSMIPITPNATGIPYAATATFLYQAAGVTTEVLAVAIPVRVISASLVFWPCFWLGLFVIGKSGGQEADELKESP